MKISEIIFLAQKQISKRDAEIFLSEILSVSLAFLITHSDNVVDTLDAKKFWECVHKKKEGFGVWDILGKKEFFGLSFLVNKEVLTPRSETEILLEKAMEYAHENAIETFVDMGTGSGCLAIVMAKNFPNASVFAIDISQKALEVAEKNAKKNGVSVHFVQSNLWENFSVHLQNALVITNLPYIPLSDEVDTATQKSDPNLALFSGETGMDLYIQFFAQIAKMKTPPKAIFFEFHPPQKPHFEEIFEKNFPHAHWKFFDDYAEQNRFGVFTKN